MAVTQQQIQWSIARMRKCLAEFHKMDKADRWYVLTRIAQKDDPAAFRMVARENPR